MDGLIEGSDQERLKNNVLLFKGIPMPMAGYEVTYIADTLHQVTRTYQVNYTKKDAAGNIVESFDLYPNILYDKSFTKIAASNPDTKQYLHKDIFNHISSLPQVEMDMDFRKQKEDSLNYRGHLLPLGKSYTFLDTVAIADKDTFVIKSYRLTLDAISRQADHPDYKAQAGDLAVSASIRVNRDNEDTTFTIKPVVVLRGQLVYYYPAQINELSSRVRLHPDIFDAAFTPEEELNYQTLEFKLGQTIPFAGLNVRFDAFNPKATHPSLEKKEGDLVVGAQMTVSDSLGKSFKAEPIFFIRDSAPFNLKAEVEQLGVHLRFVSIDPKAESVKLMLARKVSKLDQALVEVATNALRADYIVLEAIEFPGINLFWAGSTFMMLGLGLSMGYRISKLRERREG
jgi:cytochrome c-type biogenesis protein CcmF